MRGGERQERIFPKPLTGFGRGQPLHLSQDARYALLGKLGRVCTLTLTFSRKKAGEGSDMGEELENGERNRIC
jgi:hypothetical protein